MSLGLFQSMTLLHFVQQYTMPRESNTEPSRRKKSGRHRQAILLTWSTWSQVWTVLSAEAHASCAISPWERTTQQPSLLPMLTSSTQAAFFHLWKITSTNYYSCLNNLQRMMTQYHALLYIHMHSCTYRTILQCTPVGLFLISITLLPQDQNNQQPNHRPTWAVEEWMLIH